MVPTIKRNGDNTYHRDGSVSYWSVHRQQWVRQMAADVPERELAAMISEERKLVLELAARTLEAAREDGVPDVMMRMLRRPLRNEQAD